MLLLWLQGMGQIASAFPTAGGLYHWSSILGGRGWGWATAWFNVLGLIFVTASVNVGLWDLIIKPLFLANVLGMDVSGLGDVQKWIAVAIITTIQALFNHFGIRLTTRLTDFSGYLIFAVATILTIALLAMPQVLICLDFLPLRTIQVMLVVVYGHSSIVCLLLFYRACFWCVTPLLGLMLLLILQKKQTMRHRLFLEE